MKAEPIIEGLEEIRWGLAKVAAVVFVLFLVSYVFTPQIYDTMVEPLKARLAPGQNLIGTGVAEAFFVKIKLALLSALFLGSPYVFYQIWRFLAPIFRIEDRKGLLIGFVFTTSFFFIAGGLFCYTTVLPVAFLYFLGQYGSVGITPEIRVAEYFTFFFRIVLAFGITFELPIFTFFLVRLGIWNHRLLWRQFRYAVLAMFIVAAVLTPPDVVSQLLLAGPLIVLYLLSIGIAYVSRRKPFSEDDDGS